MINIFQRLSIKNKLILVIFGASMSVTIIGFAFFMYLNSQAVREEAIETARLELNVLAQDFVKIAMFSDTYIAADIVTKLRLLSSFKNIFLYDASGKLIFQYEDAPSSAMTPPEFVADRVRKEINFGKGSFQMNLPLEYAGGKYGWVFSRISTVRYEEKLSDYYQVMALAIPVMLLLSYLLAFWLQRYFSVPIMSLAERVNRIADNRAFDEQVDSDEPNEIGGLYRSVGQLLDAIRKSQDRLHQSEARLEAILDIAGSALISVDTNQRITLFNRQAESVFGYSAREVIGQPVDMLLPVKLRKSHFQLIDDFCQNGAKMHPSDGRDDVWGLRKNGEEFPLEASLSQIKLGGKMILTAALTDVTQRRRAEQELEAYRTHLENVVEERTSELRAKNSELEAFSYSVAHDLRAPLRSITSFSQILLEESASKLDSDDIDHLERVIRAGCHMAELIDGILNLARVGRGPLSMVAADLSILVTKVKERLLRDHPERNVSWNIQPGLVVRCDSQLMGLVIENLIINAWKYTGKKQQAEISFGVVDQRGKKAYFVRDTGAGFDMKYANKLFGVFQRLHSNDEFEGTGVGLATVQRIIHRHGGSIWAEAVVGDGATFYFTLPQWQ